MTRDLGSSLLLKEAGLRPTTIRERVLSTLLSAGLALSHRELVDRLAGLDRVSVFRSLKLLKKGGLIHEVRSVDGIVRFVVNPEDKAVCPGCHPHFLCLDCGRMSCLVEQRLPYVAVPEGSEVRGKQFLVYGLCPGCAAAKKGLPPSPSLPGAKE